MCDRVSRNKTPLLLDSWVLLSDSRCSKDEIIKTGKIKPKIISTEVGNFNEKCTGKEILKEGIVSKFTVRNGLYARFPRVKIGSGNVVQKGTAALTRRKINQYI